MENYSRTCAFLRGLIHLTLVQPLIDDSGLNRIQESPLPINPMDKNTPEINYAIRKAFDKLLARGVDWGPIQLEAKELLRGLATGELRRPVHADQRAQDVDAGNRDPAVDALATSTISVPVIVDAVRARGLVRVNYFCIECDVPMLGWQLLLDDASFPFLLVGLTGIILQPLGAARFDSFNQIENTFKRLEDNLGFSIAVGDLWIPEQVFKAELSPGSVFRLDSNLFRNSYMVRERYFSLETREGHYSWKDIMAQLGDFHIPEFSEMETRAFAEWSDLQIRNAEETYPKDRNLVLLDEGEQ